MSDLCPVAAFVDAMNLEDQPKTMGGSLLGLLESKKFCDVIFTFPDLPDRIEAHEFCLKARSPVFEQIFRMRKSGNVMGNEIKIGECTPERFQQFLEFIYVDKFQVDIAGAIELLQLSHKYKVQPLTEKCEELLQTQIPIKDAVNVFETALRYGRRDLMDRAGGILVKSFVKLARSGALATAEEETLIYLLKRDDLAVKEVELFQFILDWGRHKVGASADHELLRKTLRNLVSKIRFTNMALDEFTKVVVPTGLLSSDDTVSVYSYFCGDESARRVLKIKFSTIPRKMENRETVAMFVDFYANQQAKYDVFDSFSKQCVSFKVDRMQVDGTVSEDHLQNRPFLSAIKFQWPRVYRLGLFNKHDVLNCNVSIEEHSGSVNDGNFTRFQKKLLNCKQDHLDEVSVEPPVELIAGRTYSVIVENHSTSVDNSFPYYKANGFPTTNNEAYVNSEDVSVTFKEIQKMTDFFTTVWPDHSKKLAVIQGISILGL